MNTLLLLTFNLTLKSHGLDRFLTDILLTGLQASSFKAFDTLSALSFHALLDRALTFHLSSIVLYEYRPLWPFTSIG